MLTNPRKSALQKRSRVTVNALLEATARILVREGFDKASTNRIAEVAGVSVGSLYQYFPSKEALVAALIDRHNQEVMQAVQGELAEAVNLPMEQAMRKLVAVAVEAHRIDPQATPCARGADSARWEAREGRNLQPAKTMRSSRLTSSAIEMRFDLSTSGLRHLYA